MAFELMQKKLRAGLGIELEPETQRTQRKADSRATESEVSVRTGERAAEGNGQTTRDLKICNTRRGDNAI